MTSRRRIMLEMAYDGRPYAGFVRQKNAFTVAEALEDALLKLDRARSSVTCSSRTDAGVHARHQIVSFTTTKEISPRGWVLALEQHLPETLTVRAASHVALEFDPRIDPLWKRYRYSILESPVGDPFLRGRAWRVRGPLDLQLMQEEAADLVGEHDFAAFKGASDLRASTVRTLSRLSVERAPSDPRLVDIVVEGNRFLYHMVRIIAGTLVDVGRARRPRGSVLSGLSSLSRSALGMTAPPGGLCLEHVELRSPCLDRWPAPAER